MLQRLTERVREMAHRALEADRSQDRPMVAHLRNLASIANELLGQPIRVGGPAAAPGPAATAPAPAAAAEAAHPPLPAAAPVFVYFDGKDHRTKAKIEELLRSRQIAFKLLDVTDDEAERSWVTTAAHTNEFPIVVIAGTPVGGLAELTQLDLEGKLTRLVFGPS
jgi:glutaredoxin